MAADRYGASENGGHRGGTGAFGDYPVLASQVADRPVDLLRGQRSALDTLPYQVHDESRSRFLRGYRPGSCRPRPVSPPDIDRCRHREGGGGFHADDAHSSLALATSPSPDASAPPPTPQTTVTDQAAAPDSVPDRRPPAITSGLLDADT